MQSTRRLAARIPMMKLPSQAPVTARPARSTAERAALHPIEDQDNFFHGVGLNAPLVRKLWREGLLSHSEAQRRGRPLVQNFVGGYNGKENISVSRYQVERFSFGEYSQGKLSLVIDGEGLQATHYPYGGFSDEHHIVNAVPASRLRALLVPGDKLNVPVASLVIGLTGGPYANLAATTRAYIAGVYECTGIAADDSPIREAVAHYEALSIDDKVMSQEGKKREAAVEKALARFTAEAYGRKLQKSKPTLGDVLAATLPSDIPCVPHR